MFVAILLAAAHFVAAERPDPSAEDSEIIDCFLLCVDEYSMMDVVYRPLLNAYCYYRDYRWDYVFQCFQEVDDKIINEMTTLNDSRRKKPKVPEHPRYRKPVPGPGLR